MVIGEADDHVESKEPNSVTSSNAASGSSAVDIGRVPAKAMWMPVRIARTPCPIYGSS
jgi:hypothetical protein